MTPKTWAAASVLVYVLVTAVIGREVLSHLGSNIANDPGDPLLVASVLHWNAHHVPFTDAWWQLPTFSPTRDTLAFSEHLLGLSVVAAPIDWLTGDPLVTYNLVMLLTFPLCAAAMYALVYRLTGSAGGAFVAGLAFGFAPYRISHLPHVHILAAFWAPLALLGLHAYVESNKRRWLVLYGVTWMLQVATNGYSLFLFSVLVALWVIWFVVARRHWRALGMIAAATVIASLPLAPILYKYVTVHAFHGFERSIDEVRMFSADVAAVLCAPPNLTFWGWVRVACRAEGELFPGVALFVLYLGALASVLGWFGGGHVPRTGMVLTLVRRLLAAVSVVYAAVISSLLIFGPWRFELGFIRMSASSVRKPLLVFLATFFAALLLSRGIRATVRRSSIVGFYLLAAFVTWLLALGPTITVMGVLTGNDGPFMWLLTLPGANNLRVPARFWLMTAMCLATTAGIFVALVLNGRGRGLRAAGVLVAAVGVLSDGWVNRISVHPAPPAVPNPSALAGALVMTLPVNTTQDIAAGWRAVTQGWKSVNGYSGYGPSYYPAFAEASRRGDGALFTPFQREGELHVIVFDESPEQQTMIDRQPELVETGRGAGVTQYRLPRHSPQASDPGRRLHIASLKSSCAGNLVGLALDGDDRSRWICPPIDAPSEITLDLGTLVTVGSVVQSIGPYYRDFPRQLAIETSVDEVSWSVARSGSVLSEVISGGLRDPTSLRIALPFEPRETRYIRLRHIDDEPPFYWSITELEVWSGAGGGG